MKEVEETDVRTLRRR